MTQKEFDAGVASLHKMADDIVQAKRPGYTGADKDVLINFKKSGAELGITPMQAWGILFLKHIAAITSFAKSSKIPQGEPIASRFADALNYLDLGYCLAIDTIEELAPSPLSVGGSPSDSDGK